MLPEAYRKTTSQEVVFRCILVPSFLSTGMALLSTIETDIVAAMRAKNEQELSTLRLMKTALKNREIELRATGKELTDEEAMKALKTQVKQLKDAQSEYTAAGRTDLAEQAQVEIALVQKYLPAEMSDEEIRGIIAEVIRATATPSIATCMGPVMARTAGRADGARVRTLLEQQLA